MVRKVRLKGEISLVLNGDALAVFSGVVLRFLVGRGEESKREDIWSLGRSGLRLERAGGVQGFMKVGFLDSTDEGRRVLGAS